MKALQHAVNKGQIITLLKPEYPGFVDFLVLRRAMANLGKALLERELVGYLHYLEEKGFVELKRDNDQAILCAKITAAGLNLADGWVSDPAVLVD